MTLYTKKDIKRKWYCHRHVDNVSEPRFNPYVVPEGIKFTIYKKTYWQRMLDPHDHRELHDRHRCLICNPPRSIAPKYKPPKFPRPKDALKRLR